MDKQELCTIKGCSEVSVISGENGINGKWFYHFCKKHKEIMMPLLDNSRPKAREAERKSG